MREVAYLSLINTPPDCPTVIGLGLGQLKLSHSADIVNCSCPEQGQNPNSQLSIAIFAPMLPIEPGDHDQTIHRVPVKKLIVILRFYG